jgi:hypothetical protein
MSFTKRILLGLAAELVGLRGRRTRGDDPRARTRSVKLLQMTAAAVHDTLDRQKGRVISWAST